MKVGTFYVQGPYIPARTFLCMYREAFSYLYINSIGEIPCWKEKYYSLNRTMVLVFDCYDMVWILTKAATGVTCISSKEVFQTNKYICSSTLKYSKSFSTYLPLKLFWKPILLFEHFYLILRPTKRYMLKHTQSKSLYCVFNKFLITIHGTFVKIP